jgi:hypothetical protein
VAAVLQGEADLLAQAVGPEEQLTLACLIAGNRDLGELLAELRDRRCGVCFLVGVDADRDQWRSLGSGLRSRIDGGQNWVGLLHAPYQVTPSVLERDGRQDPSVSPMGDIQCGVSPSRRGR